eukprot:gnl/TRDRNA2_/TRDRNA2_167466_c3_seq2.p1 gnl/TRDRNA2_/TRDRNA2_167466_c3~~gnl/TRDRNA2_/TRDRNA2_167466_c3_seq2.p1  ORF type:complete len:286 (+),score=65.50 gnl/TRDRNA2_/TRDRNA2_167466_c3_seq2:56-913(+)
MRADAAEFVPGGGSWNPPEFVPGGAATESVATDASGEVPPSKPKGLSADAPEFVFRPGGSQADHGVDGSPDVYAGDYMAGGEYLPHTAMGMFPRTPEELELFFTPQLVDRIEQAEKPQKEGAEDGALEASEEDAQQEEEDDEEERSVKAELSEGESKSGGFLRVEGRRLTWEVQGWEGLRDLARGECLTSAAFGVAGVSPLRLILYPNGEALTGEGWCAAGLLSESQEKAKLKFEVFFNGRSSGMKVLLGKTFTCDFRRPDASHSGGLTIGMEVHENLLWTGFGY